MMERQSELAGEGEATGQNALRDWAAWCRAWTVANRKRLLAG